VETKPTIRQQVHDHVVVWLVNNPDHAVRIHRATQALKRWWSQ